VLSAEEASDRLASLRDPQWRARAEDRVRKLRRRLRDPARAFLVAAPVPRGPVSFQQYRERQLAGARRLDELPEGQRASVMELELSAWQRVIATNLTGAFLCTKYAARQMKQQRAGKIINISSIYGLVAPSKGLQVAYTVSKHALIGLTKVNAVELMPLGIQVNAIAPGWFFTEMTEELRGTSFEQAALQRIPAERWGQTGDLVGTCLYLSSSAADFVAGAVIPVEGGYLASDGLAREGR